MEAYPCVCSNFKGREEGGFILGKVLEELPRCNRAVRRACKCIMMTMFSFSRMTLWLLALMMTVSLASPIPAYHDPELVRRAAGASADVAQELGTSVIKGIMDGVASDGDASPFSSPPSTPGQ
ncbi:hypothetical protein BDZ89DRAFT_196433 [Hymenopellis radicata]|nr:hypothetical protein BDZ89DRAFT_196433 [Hymenopellis radicata]